MTWAYRVTRQTFGDDYWYAIREVYFDDDGSVMWTENEIAAASETPEGVKWALDQMQEALSLPVIDISNDGRPVID